MHTAPDGSRARVTASVGVMLPGASKTTHFRRPVILGEPFHGEVAGEWRQVAWAFGVEVDAAQSAHFIGKLKPARAIIGSDGQVVRFVPV